jgi:hypothetical protein
MKRLSEFSMAILVGLTAYVLANALGFNRGTSVELGLLLSLYGLWLGQELFTKIHH